MPRLAAASLVFVASASVLVLEILAGRLLAQYVGISLETFTGIIGTVLAGIAAGTWAGGAMADRVAPRLLLGPLLVLGGVSVLCTVPVVRFIGPSLQGGSSISIVILTGAGFLVPAAALSAISPTVVKLQLADLGHTGAVVGRLSAIGTVGALVGTYLTGFVLVAAAPTTTVIAGVGLGLVAIGVAVWAWGWASSPRHLARHGAPVTLIAVAAAASTIALDGPCDTESAYHCAQVVTDPARPSGRLLVLDTTHNSYVDLDDPTHLEFRYTRVIADVASTISPGEPLTTLHIGGGGFTLPAWLRATRPGSTSLVLEIDPALVSIAEEELGLSTGPDLRVEVGDARIAVGELPDDTFDLVIGDAFTGFSVPWHLTTTEFVAELERVMTPDGIYLLNVIDHPPLRFARAEAATLDATFDHVAVIAGPDVLAGDRGGNVILAASQQPLDTAAIVAAIGDRGGNEQVADGSDARAFASVEVLRDDHAPVDQWRR